jgi:hypothetical protein
MRFFLILFLALSLSFSTIYSEEVPSGGEMIVDVFLARPLGTVSLVLGTGLFILSSPFALLSGEPVQGLKETSSRLVVYPFNFTFVRKVGKFPGYMEELEIVTD